MIAIYARSVYWAQHPPGPTPSSRRTSCCRDSRAARVSGVQPQFELRAGHAAGLPILAGVHYENHALDFLRFAVVLLHVGKIREPVALVIKAEHVVGERNLGKHLGELCLCDLRPKSGNLPRRLRLRCQHSLSRLRRLRRKQRRVLGLDPK